MKAKVPRPVFTYVTLIRTTPEKLWRALVDPGFIEQYWFGRHNASGWRKGSPIVSCSPEGELEWKGEILQARKSRLLIYTFQPADEKEPPSRVTFEIVPLGPKTKPQGDAVQLTVRHEHFPHGSIVFPGICEGWPAILSSLKSLLETGRAIKLGWKE